jgi:hypothetical protein
MVLHFVSNYEGCPICNIQGFVIFVFTTLTKTSKRHLSQSLWKVHGKRSGFPLFLVLLDVYVEVLNTSVTHPRMLLVEHPTYINFHITWTLFAGGSFIVIHINLTSSNINIKQIADFSKSGNDIQYLMQKYFLFYANK